MENLKTIEDLYQSDLLNILKTKIKKDLGKDKVSFIQIGVNDGVTNDVAIDVIDENDEGIFIDPMDSVYDSMVENKKGFSKCIFLKLAVLPEKLKNNNKMNLLSQDPLGQGSSFVNVNEGRIINQIEVETITVSNLISNYKIKELDFLFCDTEGIDFLIIEDFLNIIQPEVMFFETCNWWCNQDTEIMGTDGIMVPIPSRQNFKLKLEGLNYYVIDYYDKEINKSQDMVAIKMKYM